MCKWYYLGMSKHKPYPLWKKKLEAWSRRQNPSWGERKFMDIMKWDSFFLFIWGIKREYLATETLGWVLDFAHPKKKWNIEIDGRSYHDVVSDYERDTALRRVGWRIMRVPVWKLTRQPDKVRADVKKFISRPR